MTQLNKMHYKYDNSSVHDNKISSSENMAFLIIISLLVLTLTLIHYFNQISSKFKNFPPGPVPLPIIGCLHLLGSQPHKSLARLALTYGPVMFLRLGQRTTVVISNAETAKEVLKKQDAAFSSRSSLDAIHALEHFQNSVVFLPADSRWRSLRKIMNANMFSGKRLDNHQDLRSRKVEELILYCKNTSQSGKSVDIGQAVFRTTLNLLSNTIFSIDLTDPFSDSATEFKTIVRGIMEEAGKPNLADYFHFLKKMDPQGIRRREAIHFKKLFDLFSSLIDTRLEQYKSSNIVDNDVLDILLSNMKENPQEMNRSHIKHLCLDMFAAGTDTTTSTVEWGMAETLRNPNIMRKAKAELHNVIGKGKVLKDGDISNLPYLQCIVKETYRLHPPVPFLVPRRVDQDVELCGYTVPKSSQVLINAWAIGRDAELWDTPLEFIPERFLNSEIDVRGTDFELIPFGAGRRICPGLPLAVRMVPVMLGSLLNSFDWKLEGSISPKELDMGEMFGFTLQKAVPLRAVPLGSLSYY